MSCRKILALTSRMKLNHTFSGVRPASGLAFTHTGHRGEPARRRSTQKRYISRPPSSTRFAREVKPLPAGRSSLPWPPARRPGQCPVSSSSSSSPCLRGSSEERQRRTGERPIISCLPADPTVFSVCQAHASGRAETNPWQKGPPPGRP